MSTPGPRRFPADYRRRCGEDGRRGEGAEPTSVMCVDAALTARMSDGGEGELAAACVGVETPLLKVAWTCSWNARRKNSDVQTHQLISSLPGS